jgi:uncharacterized membrane protein
MIEFRKLSTITAIITFGLFLVLLFFPEIIFILFQIPDNNSAFFISRRAAMLFLGIAVFSWLGRNALHSELRQAICVGLSISMLALAGLGLFELIRGFSGIGIGLAIATEFFIGVSYFRIWLGSKSA